MFLARYKEKAAKYKTGVSSEDVWSSRTEPLEIPFEGRLQDVKEMKEISMRR